MVFKNLKVSAKLWLMVVPPILALIVFLGFFIYRSNQISEESRQRLYDEIFVSTSLILNADRDFYQAAIAEKELVLTRDTLTPEAVNDLVAAYDENAVQTIERITEAFGSVSTNEELFHQFKHETADITLAGLQEAFTKHYNEWKSTYTPKAGPGTSRPSPRPLIWPGKIST